MPKYTVVDVWEPPENKAWSFTGDKGETVTLISYWLTFEGGVKAKINQKPDTDKPKIGDILEGTLEDKVSRTGKAYKSFKKTAGIKYTCESCGHEGRVVFGGKTAQNGPGGVTRPPTDTPPPKPDESQNPDNDTNLEDIPFP